MRSIFIIGEMGKRGSGSGEAPREIACPKEKGTTGTSAIQSSEARGVLVTSWCDKLGGAGGMKLKGPNVPSGPEAAAKSLFRPLGITFSSCTCPLSDLKKGPKDGTVSETMAKAPSPPSCKGRSGDSPSDSSAEDDSPSSLAKERTISSVSSIIYLGKT